METLLEASLVRRVGFTATHRYELPSVSAEENRQRFGPQALPHSHDWELEVEVTGPMDPHTGFVVDLPALDQLLEGLVAPLRGNDLNGVIPEVRDGTMQPSTESLAAWFWRSLEPQIPGAARLTRVRVYEARDLFAEFRGGR